MPSDGYFQAFGPPKTNQQIASERADSRLYEEAEAREQRRTGLDVNGFPLRTVASLARPPMPEKTPEELAAYWTKYVKAFEAQWRAGVYWTPLDAIRIDKLREQHGIELSPDFERALRKKLYWHYGEEPEPELRWVNGEKPTPQIPEPYEQHAMGFDEQ